MSQMFQIRKNRQWEDPSIRLFTCSSMFHNTRDPEATPSQARYDWTLQDHLHQKCLEHITFDRRVADGSIGTGKLCSSHSLNHSWTSLKVHGGHIPVPHHVWKPYQVYRHLPTTSTTDPEVFIQTTPVMGGPGILLANL